MWNFPNVDEVRGFPYDARAVRRTVILEVKSCQAGASTE